MITWNEILGKYKESDIPPEYLENMKELHSKLNIVRKAYNKPMTLTNVFRSMIHHLKIYADKGITDKSKIPLKSKHLFGQAGDVADPTGDLMDWCKDNTKLLEEIGLWCEEADSTPRVHFQTVPYGSYKAGKSRFFNP